MEKKDGRWPMARIPTDSLKWIIATLETVVTDGLTVGEIKCAIQELREEFLRRAVGTELKNGGKE